MTTTVKRQKPTASRSSKQAGGTFFGLILGLIIGLTIAVVVAMMITKSPIPFVNKVIKQERTELSPGQASDPNKPLYGNKDSGKDAAVVDEAKPATDVQKADVVPTPSKNADVPVSTAKQQNSKADDAAASSGEEKMIYFLQTGAFREQADAESARAKLALLGFESQVSERPSDNGTLYRVRIGPISQLETVNRMRSKLSDNGVDAAVVRTTK